MSQKRAKRKREAGERALKAVGVAEFRVALEAAARDRVVIERWGAGVSLAVMESLSRAAALETRSEAEARGGNKKKCFPKRRITSTWLLVEGARAEAYEREVGITDVAHRALLRETAEQQETAEAYDAKKMFFYYRMIIITIAEHLSEDDGRSMITAEHLNNSASDLVEARNADPTCGASIAYRVNFSRVARQLRVASGKHGVMHTGDGGQVLTDILAHMGVPAGLYVPLRRSRGARAQRRGARILVMADGRKERAPRAVTRKAAAAELVKLEASGEVDVGREFPPRLYIETHTDDGTACIKPIGACGRVLNLRARTTRRLKQMMDDWQVAWRPAFESMGEEEVERQLARRKLPPRHQTAPRKPARRGKRSTEDGEEREEPIESARSRLAHAWLMHMSPRFKEMQAGGKCSASCEHCEPFACCSGCGQSRANEPCACGLPDVLRCGRCARMGRHSPADVRIALAAIDAAIGAGDDAGDDDRTPSSPMAQQRELERVLQVERFLHVSELLVALGQPARVDGEDPQPEDEDGWRFRDPREERLLRAQMSMGVCIALWADGSPMLNKPWQLCTWHLMYDVVHFPLGQIVERECRRPEVFFIMQDTDDLEALKYHNGVRLEELHAFNEPLELPGGLRLQASVRYLEGDNPELQRACGCCSGGGAEQSCCRCKARRHEHTDLVASARAPLRSLGEAVALAEQAAEAGEAYQLRFGPSQGTAAELAGLAYILGVEGGVGKTRKQNERKVHLPICMCMCMRQECETLRRGCGKQQPLSRHVRTPWYAVLERRWRAMCMCMRMRVRMPWDASTCTEQRWYCQHRSVHGRMPCRCAIDVRATRAPPPSSAPTWTRSMRCMRSATSRWCPTTHCTGSKECSRSSTRRSSRRSNPVRGRVSRRTSITCTRAGRPSSQACTGGSSS